MRQRTRISPRSRGLLATAGAALALTAGVPGAGAADVGALEQRVASARAEAEALAGEIQARQAELAQVQAEAAAAAAREQQLSALLAQGEERAAALHTDVLSSRERLEREQQRLGRARDALAERLVAIYKSGVPDPASVILESDGFDDLVSRSGYLTELQQADNDIAERVEEVRDEVEFRLGVVRRLERRAEAYNARLAAATSQIASVRAQAEGAAAELAAAVDSRAALVAGLQSDIEGWVGDIQAAEAAAARRAQEEADAAAAESAEEAEAEVERWLGGPYTIPAYIVMCESGGNYSALNPSSGAGGAYQILPSTWEAYGGEGAPHEAPRDEQDAIAAQIWADSGGGAWVCAG